MILNLYIIESEVCGNMMPVYKEEESVESILDLDVGKNILAFFVVKYYKRRQ